MEVQRYVQTKSIYPVRNKSNLSDDSQDSESIKAPCGSSNGVYVNRTFGGNRHCCIIDGDIDAGAAAGKETGQCGGVQGQSA